MIRIWIALLISLMFTVTSAFAAGTAINETGEAADASAVLDAHSTTKGFLPPRMTETQKNAIATPATGLTVYQTDGTTGLYVFDGSAWKQAAVGTVGIAGGGTGASTQAGAANAILPVQTGNSGKYLTTDGTNAYWVNPVGIYPVLPTLTTTAASNTTSYSLSTGGTISNDGGAAITVSGVCWNTTGNPTTANSKTTDNAAMGAFSSTVTGLTVNTTYYLRAYATNSVGTAYGNTLTVTPVYSTASFSYTGAQQTWTVPAGITSVVLEAWGAQGGSGSGNIGGLGGYSKGTRAVTPGETLYIYVGQQPTPEYTAGYHAGGWNGGGRGFTNGQSGGGASDVRAVSNNLANRVIVAGGGGGTSSWGDYNGGSGGGSSGGNATNIGTYNPAYCGGGGTQSAGGAKQSTYAVGTAGSWGLGGDGGNSGNNSGGGGGGGYYGGGSGDAGGGGGGSGYIGGVTGGMTANAYRSGHGQVVISW